LFANTTVKNSNSSDIITVDTINVSGKVLSTPYAVDYALTGHAILNGVVYEIDRTQRYSGGDYEFRIKGGYTGGSITGNTVQLVIHEQQTHKQANPTWIDIIGDPANIAATFPQGVEGQWIPVVPDNSSKEYKLNRKQSTRLSSLFTTNSGASWTVSGLSVSTTSNSYTNSESATQIRLYNYETQSHFTADDVNSNVLDLGDVIIQGGYYAPYWGAGLSNSLLSKVATSPVGGAGHSETTMKHVTIRGDTGKLNQTTGSIDNNINNTISKPNPNSDSSGIKTLDYLSSENSVAKLMYAYKEMVYDSALDNTNEYIVATSSSSFVYTEGNYYKFNAGIHAGQVLYCVESITAAIDAYSWLQSGVYNSGMANGTQYFKYADGNGWGDNNQFEITNNQATQTDDNGNTVKYGTASFNTQYFIVEE